MEPQEAPQFETGPAPETAAEGAEMAAGFEAPKPMEQKAEAASAPAPAPKAPARSASAAPAKDPITMKVEMILEEGLGETYSRLPPKAKAKFKTEGERVTREISAMVRTLKVKAGKVLSLITRWLKIIPGVNKFFLAQEAKIKTDRVVAAAEAEKAERMKQI